MQGCIKDAFFNGQHISDTITCHTGVPQVSVLEHIFSQHMYPQLAVGDVIQSFGISCHQFASLHTTIKLYVRLNSAVRLTSAVLDQVTACTTAAPHWFLTNGVLLNADESKVVSLETRHQLHSATSSVQAAVNVARLQRLRCSAFTQLPNSPNRLIDASPGRCTTSLYTNGPSMPSLGLTFRHIRDVFSQQVGYRMVPCMYETGLKL